MRRGGKYSSKNGLRRSGKYSLKNRRYRGDNTEIPDGDNTKIPDGRYVYLHAGKLNVLNTQINNANKYLMSPNLLHETTGLYPSHGESLGHANNKDNEFMIKKLATSMDNVSFVRVNLFTDKTAMRTSDGNNFKSRVTRLYERYGKGPGQSESELTPTVDSTFSNVGVLYVAVNDPVSENDYTPKMQELKNRIMDMYAEEETIEASVKFFRSQPLQSDISGEYLLKKGRIIAVMIESIPTELKWPSDIERLRNVEELVEYVNNLPTKTDDCNYLFNMMKDLFIENKVRGCRNNFTDNHHEYIFDVEP